MAEEFLATGISQDDAALFRLINENMKSCNFDGFIYEKMKLCDIKTDI